MKLYVDIGNSRIKLISEENGFSEPVSSAYKQGALADVLTPITAQLGQPERIVVANVAGDKIAAEFTSICRQAWSIDPFYIAPARECLGLKNGYKIAEQLGIDRWLAMIAAWDIYSGPLCIVDCGTALTLDLIMADGVHMGGYILPGMELMVRSLNYSTAGIRAEAGPDNNRSPGRSTGEALSHAALRSSTAFIEDIYREYSGDSGIQMKCIMTGGDAGNISHYLKIPFKLEPLLIFKGIRLVDGKMP